MQCGHAPAIVQRCGHELAIMLLITSCLWTPDSSSQHLTVPCHADDVCRLVYTPLPAGLCGTSGTADGGATTTARLSDSVQGVADDHATDTVFFVDTASHTLRRLGAGTSLHGMYGMRVGLQFFASLVLLLDKSLQHLPGHLCTGVVSTLAGTPGQSGYVEGTGIAARFNNPSAIAHNPADPNAVYVFDK